MLTQELVEKVKENLDIFDMTKDLLISDIIQETLNYCNLKELPITLEPFIRKKVKLIIDYEKENGDRVIFDIKSIKEGDTSITYNVNENTSKENIYGLSNKDKSYLKLFRRMRR